VRIRSANSRLIDLQVGHLFYRPAAETPLSSNRLRRRRSLIRPRGPRREKIHGGILCRSLFCSADIGCSLMAFHLSGGERAQMEIQTRCRMAQTAHRDRERTAAAPPADSFIGKLPAERILACSLVGVYIIELLHTPRCEKNNISSLAGERNENSLWPRRSLALPLVPFANLLLLVCARV